MFNKKRVDLKVKRKTSESILLAHRTVQRYPSSSIKKITISESSKALFYSAVCSQKGSTNFKNFGLPKSEITGKRRVKPPSLTIQSSGSFFPSPNIELLTRKPLLPLNFETTINPNPYPESADNSFSRSKDTCKESSKPLNNCRFLNTEEIQLVSESPPPLPKPLALFKTMQAPKCSPKKFTSSFPGSIENSTEENGMIQEIDEEWLGSEDIDDLSFSDIEELSHDKERLSDDKEEWSHDKNLEEFDKLCEEIDCTIYDNEPILCLVCGLELPSGSTSKDLDEHIAMCCPVDDIIVLD